MKTARPLLPAPSQPDPQRRRLLLSFPTTLVAASPLALLGCGGGGGSSGGSPAPSDPMAGAPAMTKEPLAVQVTLPAGVTKPLDKMALMSGASIAKVTTSGQTGFVTLDRGASLTYLIADDGAVMGVGLLAPDRTTLDARATAEALVYLCCQTAPLGAAVQVGLREALKTSALVDPVVPAVEAAMRAGGLSATDPVLMDALMAAVTAIRRPAAALARRQSRVRTSRLSYDDLPHSGIRVVEQPGFNTFRRRLFATVETFGYMDQDGNIVNTPVETLGTFKVDPTDALNVSNTVTGLFDVTAGAVAREIGLIGDYQLGSIPWTEKTSDPFAVPPKPEGAREILLRVSVVGLGAEAPSRPLTAQEQVAYDDFFWTTLEKDVVVPFLNTVLMPLAGQMLEKNLEGKSSALVAAAFGLDLLKGAAAQELLPQTCDALQRGQWFEALLAAAAELTGTDGGKKLLTTALANVSAWVGTAVVKVVNSSIVLSVDLNSPEGRALAKSFVHGLERINTVVDRIEKGMLALDIGAQAKDYANSRKLEEFRIDASLAQVTLSPVLARLSPSGDSQVFTVTGIDGQPPTADLLYEWTCPSQHGFLTVSGQATSPANPTLLAAPSATALYTVGGGNTGGEIDNITVRVFNGTKQFMGRGSAAVEMQTLVRATLTPAEALFERNVDGQQVVFSVTLDPAPANPADIRYDWICPSAHGVLTSDGVSTSQGTPRITTTKAGASYALGTGKVGGERENVSVEVFRREVDVTTGAESWKSIATAQSVARVKSEFTLGILPVSGTQVPLDKSLGVTAVFRTPLPRGATVAWTWSHAGVGSITPETPDANPADSVVMFNAGASEGSATITVSALVTIPASGTTPSRTVAAEPVTTTLQVKALATLTLQSGWMYEVIWGDPFTFFGCGTEANPTGLCRPYQVFCYAVIPKVPGAKSTTITLDRPTKDPLGTITFPQTFNATSGRWADRGGYWVQLLSAVNGTAGENGVQPGAHIATEASRFDPMSVTVTVTF